MPVGVVIPAARSGCRVVARSPNFPTAHLRHMLDRADAAAVISNDSDLNLCGAARVWPSTPSQVAAEPEVLASELSAHSLEMASFGPRDCAYIPLLRVDW
jgi:hypothetical protein